MAAASVSQQSCVSSRALLYQASCLSAILLGPLIGSNRRLEAEHVTPAAEYNHITCNIAGLNFINGKLDRYRSALYPHNL